MKKWFKALLFFTLFFLFSCNKINIKAGEESLQGEWEVVEIYTAFGERSELGVNTNESFTEEGDLGRFMFSENEVEYSYIRLDTLYEGTSFWNLERDKVNEGFVRVEQYTLVLEYRSFDCEFGDETSDAERDANMVRLIFETKETGAYENFVLSLEKL